MPIDLEFYYEFNKVWHFIFGTFFRGLLDKISEKQGLFSGIPRTLAVSLGINKFIYEKIIIEQL